MPRHRAAAALLAIGIVLAVVTGISSAGTHPRNGRIAYVHSGTGDRFQIYTMTATGTHRHPLTVSRRYSSYDPAYAPRGKRIVFVRAFKQSDLWVMKADGTHKRRLTSTAGVDEKGPSWSPDGKQIAFSVDSPAAKLGLWVMEADGSGRQRLTTADDRNPAWSPDGTEMAFDRYDAATQTESIFVLPVGGGTPTKLSSDPGISDLGPAWSPDGGRILFASDRPDGSQLDLWAINLQAMSPGPSIERVTNTPNRDESGAAWSPDGRRIVYSGQGAFHGASSSQIYVSRANGSNRRTLTHACGDCAYANIAPSWQPLR